MINTLVMKRQTVKTKTLVTILGIILSIALPQVFHGIGIVSGSGAVPGSTFLPMHLPVLLVGLLCGSAAGLACGLISPILSFAISGMPVAGMLPFMTIELAVYGLVAGSLLNVKIPTVAKVLVSQVAGRVVRAAAIVCAIYLFGNQSINISQTWNVVLTGLPGIILQLCILPLLMYRIENSHE